MPAAEVARAEHAHVLAEYDFRLDYWVCTVCGLEVPAEDVPRA